MTITIRPRWSQTRGKPVVPSRWQATSPTVGRSTHGRTAGLGTACSVGLRFAPPGWMTHGTLPRPCCCNRGYRRGWPCRCSATARSASRWGPTASRTRAGDRVRGADGGGTLELNQGTWPPHWHHWTPGATAVVEVLAGQGGAPSGTRTPNPLIESPTVGRSTRFAAARLPISGRFRRPAGPCRTATYAVRWPPAWHQDPRTRGADTAESAPGRPPANDLSIGGVRSRKARTHRSGRQQAQWLL